MITKIQSDYDADNCQHVLNFYLSNQYEAENARVNLLLRLRNHIGFTIDVLNEGNIVVVKYVNESDKEKILYIARMILT